MGKKKQSKTAMASDQVEVPIVTSSAAFGDSVITDSDVSPAQNQEVDDASVAVPEKKLFVKKGTHVLIAAPCYGAQVKEVFFQSMMKLIVEFMKLGVSFTIKTIACESLIVRARNYFAAYVLSKPEFTHLLFIDTDIQFTPLDVLRLIAIDKDIACAPYPKKYVDWGAVQSQAKLRPEQSLDEMRKSGIKYVINFNNNKEDSNVTKTGDDQLTIKVENGFIKVKDSGTGFMLIRKNVLERMKNEYKDIELYKNNIDMYNDASPENFYTYFDCMVDPSSGYYLSEDYAFCRKWQMMGGDIWLDTNSTLGHYGDYLYLGGSFMERFS